MFPYRRKFRRWFLVFSIAAGVGAACATSPLGRKQFIIIPDNQMNQMGVQAFSQLKATQAIDSDHSDNAYVQCVVTPLVQVVGEDADVKKWEVVVFRSPEANAFALPGGKIGVYTGLFKVAKTDSQLAAVIGHEIGHVIARHGAERVSQQAGTQLGLTALGAISKDNPNANVLMGLLGLGAQVGILLPFSRAQESEADLIGLDLMVRAGFDPRQSVQLWRNMIANSGGKSPPEFLSTHPASENRIAHLEQKMKDAIPKYDQARAGGKNPHCELPH